MTDDDLEPDRASVARIHDFWLDGAQNLGVDRTYGDLIEAANRNARHAARSNRAVLARVVRSSLRRGIHQFLDLGSGPATVGAVHEVCAATDPAARVAYVEAEPIALARAREILRGSRTATVSEVDVRDPQAVLTAPGVAGLLDFSRPVTILGFQVVHYLEGDLAAILRPYREHVVPGSALAISHVTDDLDDPELVGRIRAAAEVYARSGNPVVLRTRAQLLAVFEGMTLLAPGLVDVVDWPEPAAPRVEKVGLLAAMGLV